MIDAGPAIFVGDDMVASDFQRLAGDAPNARFIIDDDNIRHVPIFAHFESGRN